MTSRRQKRDKIKLTKRTVEGVKPEAQTVVYRDTELNGFQLRVTPTGRRSYFAYYRTVDGRERRPKIGDHGTITCEQARDKARQWLALATTGKDPSGERKELRDAETFADFAEQYFDHVAGRKKESTLATDRINLRCHLIPALGRHHLSAISRVDVARLHHKMKLTPGAANRTIAVLSHMMNVAERWGLRPDGSNPCRHVEKYRERKRERFLSEVELAHLADVLNEAERTQTAMPSVIAAIRLLLFTGARLSEILTLRWEYVDIEGQCLRLPDSKTGAKTIYLPPAALEVLSELERQNDNPHVIIGAKPGSRLINLQKPWRRIRKQAGLDDVRIHDLRHTFASMAVAGGLSLPMIGALLGHTQPSTTARYAHLADDPKKQAADLIGGWMAAAMNQGEREENSAQRSSIA